MKIIQSHQKQRFFPVPNVQCGYGSSQHPNQWGLGFHHWGHNGRCVVKLRVQGTIPLCLCHGAWWSTGTLTLYLWRHSCCSECHNSTVQGRVCFLNCALWYTYVMRTNRMHTYCINDLIQLYCLWHVLNNQVFILWKICTCRFYGIFSCNHLSSLVDVGMFDTVSNTSQHQPDCLGGCVWKIP